MASGRARKIRVLVVEDHPVTLLGMRVVLEEQPDIELVATARSAREAEEAVERHGAPDVLMTDFHLPDRSGADLVRALRRRIPHLIVVTVSADDSPETMLEAVEAGAVGYVVKSEQGEEIAGAIRRAAAGEMLVPAETLAEALRRQRRASGRREERERIRASLTRREREVLALTASGLENKEIATRLGIGLNTVRGYAQTLLEKMEVHSKLEAVVKAGELGLLEDETAG